MFTTSGKNIFFRWKMKMFHFNSFTEWNILSIAWIKRQKLSTTVVYLICSGCVHDGLFWSTHAQCYPMSNDCRIPNLRRHLYTTVFFRQCMRSATLCQTTVVCQICRGCVLYTTAKWTARFPGQIASGMMNTIQIFHLKYTHQKN